MDKRSIKTDMFGEAKLAGILKENGSLSPDEIRDAILKELEGYIASDDVTMVVIKRV